MINTLQQLSGIFQVRVICPLLEKLFYALEVCFADAVVGQDPIIESDVITCYVREFKACDFFRQPARPESAARHDHAWFSISWLFVGLISVGK